MLAVFLVIVETGETPWRETEATVLASRIKHTRPGTPQWSLEVDFAYAVDGKRFDRARLYVFHDADRSVTKARQMLWPEGRIFTVYTRPSDPASYSLAKDGDREALAVVASLAVPTFVALAWLAWTVRKRSKLSRVAFRA